MKKLSVIIPAYNEENFIGKLIDKILAVKLSQFDTSLEIIVVDDCSTDNTKTIVEKYPTVTYYRQEKNMGKGAAVKKGISHSTGDWILVQDADLEYEPEDYAPMMEKLLNSKSPAAVYGSRALGQMRENKDIFWLLKSKHPDQKVVNWLASKFLTFFTFVLYGVWITDTLTAYKLYPGNLLRSYTIKTRGFETDHELTALLVQNKIDILEVPIYYYPRSVEEGKKIKAIDFFIALKTLTRFRFLQ